MLFGKPLVSPKTSLDSSEGRWQRAVGGLPISRPIERNACKCNFSWCSNLQKWERIDYGTARLDGLANKESSKAGFHSQGRSEQAGQEVTAFHGRGPRPKILSELASVRQSS